MDTCFLFTKHLTDKSCVFQKLSETGELLIPPSPYSFEDIRTLQQASKTIVVESSENTSILALELSWLPERKARMAIPFALEEQLACPVHSLHFAFDKLRYQDNRYLVFVISKERMQHLMRSLTQEEIQFSLITTDWFALCPQELLVTESTLLLHQTDFKGALSGDLAAHYLHQHPLSSPLLFQDSQILPDANAVKKEDSSFTWIARRILKTKPLNLCQGEMERGNEFAWIKKGFYVNGLLFCICLLSILMVNMLDIRSISNKTAKIDEQIALIYRQFFPEATQVISPKFRIQQALSLQAKTSDAHFWFLLNQFAKSITNTPLSIEQLRYHDQSLSIRLRSPDFASIAHLKNKMMENQLQPKQTEAQTKDQQVVVTLELT